MDNRPVSDPLSPRERRSNARELQRRMAELDRLDAAYGLGAPPRATRATPRRSLSFTTAITLAATAALVTMVLALHPSSQVESVRRLVGLGSERGLPAPSIEELGGSYRFTMMQRASDEPVGWDPCQPIRYQVNPDGSPEGGEALIDRAVERISTATGLVFESEGTTDKRPFTAQFVPIGTDRPVIIGWATAAEFPTLAGDIAGIGGGAAEEGVRGRRFYVTGGVALDTDVFTAEQVANAPQIMEAIVLHELAHVVGLYHVNEPMELMAATNSGQIDLGPGDREGLARLGSLPCA